MCVLIRDVHTLALLAAAQTASVLVGFALEYALGTRDLEDPLEKTYLAHSPPTLLDHPRFEFGIANVVCGPIVDERFMRTPADSRLPAPVILANKTIVFGRAGVKRKRTI
jgi:hypothetical protein